jgi:hypothetical protein
MGVHMQPRVLVLAACCYALWLDGCHQGAAQALPRRGGDGGQQLILEVHLQGTVVAFTFFQPVFFQDPLEIDFGGWF